MSPKRLITTSLVLAVSVLAASGCSSKPPTSQQMLTAITTGTSNLTTFHNTMSMVTTVDMTVSDKDSTLVMNINSDNSSDISNKAQQTTFNVDMSMAGQKQTGTITVYVLDGWIYMAYSDSSNPGQWEKTKPPQPIWLSQSQIDQQLSLLKGASDVTVRDAQSLNGVPCYLINATPDLQAVATWFLTQQEYVQTGMMEIGNPNLASSVFKNVSMSEWVSKKDSRLLKTELILQMAPAPADIGITDTTVTAVKMDMKADITYSDYGKKYSIQLPEEANTATEIPWN